MSQLTTGTCKITVVTAQALEGLLHRKAVEAAARGDLTR